MIHPILFTPSKRILEFRHTVESIHNEETGEVRWWVYTDINDSGQCAYVDTSLKATAKSMQSECKRLAERNMDAILRRIFITPLP